MTRNNKIFAAAASIAALSMPLGGVAAQADPNATVTTPTLEPAEDAVTTTQPMTDTSATADTSGQATTTSPDAQTTTADPAMGQSTTTDSASTDSTGTAAASGATVAASAADVTAGAKVMDTQGGEVGTVESADGSNAVVATGKARVQIPIASFAKNEQGLVISLTKSQLEAQAGSPSA